jgi:hypothetical protein
MYQYGRNGIILRLSDGASIPPDAANSDYQACLRWVALGNTILPRDAQDVAAEAAELATGQQQVQDIAAARQNAKLQALATRTPAQVQAWVDANVNNLADAKDVLSTLAVAVSVLARRL